MARHEHAGFKGGSRVLATSSASESPGLALKLWLPPHQYRTN
jgi:hypothetical protein